MSIWSGCIDSKPINEFNETVNKAKALIKAIE